MTFPEITLLRPWCLLALIPAGLVLWRLARAPVAGESAWRKVVDAHLAPYVLAGNPGVGRKAGLVLSATAVVLAILALAGPGVGQPAEGAYRRDLTRVVVVELSAAMAIADGPSSRLDRVKHKILDLLRSLPAGQTALLVYGGEPYLVVPPSTDPETVARFVPELAADVVPVAGSRPDLALQMAGRILARSGSRAKEVLWITAGAGAVELPPAGLEGMRLSILHAAPARDEALAALVERRGGVYAAMTAGDGDVRRLAAAPAGGGGWIAEAGYAGDAVDLGPWLILALLPLAALAFRRGLLTVLAAPLLAGGLLASPEAQAREASPVGHLSDYLAWQRLKTGDAEGAAEGFSDRRWRAAAGYRAGHFEEAAALLEGLRDADSLYNRGNALARQGRLTEALTVYEASLELREDADARYNRDLVEKLLKQGGSGQGGSGKAPPDPAPGPASGSQGNAEAEAASLAGQWLRQVPDDPGSLLRRKLQAEHRRRQAGEGARPW